MKSRSMRALALLLVVSLLAGLGGCGLFRDSSIQRVKGPRLAKEIARLPELNLEPAASVRESLIASDTEILEAYRAIYGKVANAEANRELGKRLADLELARAEELSAEGIAANPFASAVELYEDLLANASEDEPRDALLYQLAQANDMAGKGKDTERYLDQLIEGYPDSPYVLEARFRRGEMLFSQGRFGAAVADYSQVTAAGDSTKYWLHASYMLGWSHFKQSDLDEASQQFYQVVELMADVDAADARGRAQKELLDDALRVLMLTLNYEDGAQSLAADMRDRNKPDWQYLVYEGLAADHVEQERYVDGVAAWQTFVDENPLDPRAPSATVGAIAILVDADFPSEVVPKKAEYVERYGVRSDFWKAHSADTRLGYEATLRSYLAELSQLRHAEAQRSGVPRDYLAAADYYEQTMETFPEDPKTGDTLFLLGDVYTDAALPERSLEAYERLIKKFPEHPKAADAGYSSVLALAELGASAPEDERAGWRKRHLVAQINFAEVFAEDPRAPAVQAAAADQLFASARFEDAIELAEDLLVSRPELDQTLKNTSQLIIGHGSMELEQYVDAEEAYLRYLASPQQSRDPAAASRVEEQLLASVYKQGEAAEQSGNLPKALEHYLRIAQLGPGSEIAALAHYDAIGMIEGAPVKAGNASGNEALVTELLTSFRSLYPNDERSSEVPGRLAARFEENKDYSAAASEYLNVATTSGDPEQQRQAQYLAAELFLKDGDKPRAFREFTRYTNTFSKPYDVHMAALDIQDTLLEEQGALRNLVWQKKVDIHAQARGKATERMNYLAAEAQLGLADIDRNEFDSIRLTQPLKQSLKAKQDSLKGTIAGYKQVLDYGVSDFVTAASFQIADMYTELSRSILESDRPGGLDELALEQYEILLEEQAFPFEEQAIELHQVNLQRMWQGSHDDWTKRSLAALRVLMPGRFDKNEVQVAYVDTIH